MGWKNLWGGAGGRAVGAGGEAIRGGVGNVTRGGAAFK
jgi:hypothetical protein